MSTATPPRRPLSALPERAGQSNPGWIQSLTIGLEGITADDYLAWIRNPEPSVLGRDLRSLTLEADPDGQFIDLELVWDGQPPATDAAVAAAGFPLTPEVVAVQDRRQVTAQQEEAERRDSHIQNGRVQGRFDDLHRAAARANHQRAVGSAGRTAPSSRRGVRELIACWTTAASPFRTHS